MAQAPSLLLDHLTVTARTLEEGASYIRETLGIEMPSGGEHPRMGTHNRLLSLGRDLFLEVIAINPSAKEPGRSRWYGLDMFDASPRLATWVLGTTDIFASMAQAHSESGAVVEMTRGDLNWLISVPDEGSMPMDGAYPTLIEWPHGPHPASDMEDCGCGLRSLRIEHPQIQLLRSSLTGIFSDERVEIAFGSKPKLSAVVSTPKGDRVLF